MDLSNLSKLVVDTIKPLLVKKQGNTSEFQEDFSDALWDWIKPIFIENGDMEILRDLSIDPDDELNIQALQYKLRKVLSKNPEKAEELKKIIDEEFEKIKSQQSKNQSYSTINTSIGHSIGNVHKIGNINIK